MDEWNQWLEETNRDVQARSSKIRLMTKKLKAGFASPTMESISLSIAQGLLELHATPFLGPGQQLIKLEQLIQLEQSLLGDDEDAKELLAECVGFSTTIDLIRETRKTVADHKCAVEELETEISKKPQAIGKNSLSA